MDQPDKVLITGGHEIGGLASFAEALLEGFQQLGVPCEIISPTRIWHRWRELRDPRVLKILSTTAVFAAPLSRRAICVSHGFPTAGIIGWKKFIGHLAADKVANRFRQVCVATVSQYAAIHLRAILGVRVDAVVPNAVRQIFLDPPATYQQRFLITYAGRLHPAKNLRLLLHSVIDLVEERPEVRACIIGDGPERATLEQIAKRHPRIEFTGPLDRTTLRHRLRETKVFVSGCPTEALGITYLEALSQGCNVVMPAGGGGLEIAPQLIGSQIQLVPLTLDRTSVSAAIRRALAFEGRPINIESYAPAAIASAYLCVGEWLNKHGFSRMTTGAPFVCCGRTSAWNDHGSE